MTLGIQALIILDHSGIPLFYTKTDPKSSNIDLPLITSFLQATTAFDNEVFVSKNRQQTVILNYGYSKVCVETGEFIDVVLIVNSFTKEIKSVLKGILKIFQDKFCINCYANDRDSCLSCTVFSQIKSPYFDDFYHELSHFPRMLGWEPDLVPYIIESKIESIDFNPQTDVLELIDGVLTLGDLLLVYYKNDHVVYDLLLAYNNDIIGFKRIS